MAIELKHPELPNVILRWNIETGELTALAEWQHEVIAQIKKVAQYAIEDGYIAHVINGVNFPVTDPLKNKDEFALVLNFLGYTSDQVPVPTLKNDHSEIVIY